MGLRYKPSEWAPFRHFFVLFLVILSGFFLACHVTNYFIERRRVRSRTTRLHMLDNAFRLKRDIIAYNSFSVLGSPAHILLILLPVESSLKPCKDMNIYMTVMYLILNFLAYRVLLSKAAVYDAMTQYSSRQRIIFWIVHVINVAIIIIVFLSTWNSNRTQTVITQSIGENACATTISGDGRATPAILVAFVDLGVSLACLYLLLIPILSQQRSSLNDMGAFRNVGWALVAIISTLGFLCFTIVQLSVSPPVYIYQRITLGLIDACINVFSVNMFWPAGYYLRAFKAWGLITWNVETTQRSSGVPLSRKRRSVTPQETKRRSLRPSPTDLTSMTTLMHHQNVSVTPRSPLTVSGSGIKG
ncbi:hypothetical protein AAMO2058_001250600 [Amorphochlora amoebiformis]